MKLDCYVMDVQVLTKNVINGKTKPDGTFNVYYQLGIRSNDELGTVNCTLDVFNAVIVDKHYDFHFDYETRFDKVFIKFDKYNEATVSKK